MEKAYWAFFVARLSTTNQPEIVNNEKKETNEREDDVNTLRKFGYPPPALRSAGRSVGR